LLFSNLIIFILLAHVKESFIFVQIEFKKHSVHVLKSLLIMEAYTY
ncbi:MAG: hypothetical protein ACI96W_003884, partial [Paraglaciecola sp.]